MKVGKKAWLFLGVLLWVVSPLYAAEVKNDAAKQVGGRVQFTYDLVGDEAEADVDVTITVAGKEYKPADLHLEGDIGKVTPGKGKTIWWNVLQDFPKGLNTEIDCVIASGGKDFVEKKTGMSFAFVKGGCFQMGDSAGDGDKDEKPVHEVCVDDFYLGKYEVTVGQFRQFVKETGYRTDAEKNTGGNLGCYALDFNDSNNLFTWRAWASWRKPSKYQDNQDNHPVACVSWNDAQAFVQWLAKKSGKRLRLPTEAEAEYAARGGTTGRNYWGEGKDDACSYANVADQTKLPNGQWWTEKHECSDGYAFASPVGSFSPNAFGLYDMMGNVNEWCSDWYGENYYSESPKRNPRGPDHGSGRVARGGSWGGLPRGVRASIRSGGTPDDRYSDIGLRVAGNK